MSTTPPSSPFDLECYRLIRAQIEFEDNLIAQRISWFVAAQSFLFTAYAITLDAPTIPARPEFTQQQRWVYVLIPVVAMSTCVLLYVSVIGGVVAQTALRRRAAEQLSAPQVALLPPIQGSAQTRLLGRAASLGLPLIFAVIWLFLFVNSLMG